MIHFWMSGATPRACVASMECMEKGACLNHAAMDAFRSCRLCLTWAHTCFRAALPGLTPTGKFLVW
eukprot:1152301-Pelagomonas_calceolata.AAC.2